MRIGQAKEKISKRFLRPGSPPVFIWGGPGIGKSQIMKQITSERDMDFIDFRLSQIDPVDLRGPLMQTEDGEMRWLSPSLLPDGGRGVLFLDELNLAPTAIQNAAYQLVYKGRVGEYELPEGWAVVAAGNKQEHAQVHAMQPPLRSRFYHIEVDANLDDWKKWALDNELEKSWAVDNKVNPMVIGYLNKNPGELYKFDPSKDEMSYPCPRTWELASYLLDTGAAYSDLSGAIGAGAASKFSGYLKVASDMPDPDSILEDGEDIIPEKPDIKYAVASSLVARTKEKPEYLPRLFRYAIALGDDEHGGTEFAVLIGRDAIDSGLDPSTEGMGEDNPDALEAFREYTNKYKKTVSSI